MYTPSNLAAQPPGVLLARFNRLRQQADAYREAGNPQAERAYLMLAADLVAAYPTAIARVRQLMPDYAAMFPPSIGGGIVGHA